MHKRQGIAQIVLLFVILLAVAGVSVACLYNRQISNVPSATPNGTTQPYTSITPITLSPSPLMPTASPTPSPSSLCNISFACSFVINSGTNVELLLTSPSSLQTGYIRASNSDVNDIPNASYGIQHPIGDASGQASPKPDMTYLGVSNVENGIYILEIIAKQPGNYHLDIGLVLGPVNSRNASIDGTLATNQVDKYTIAIPSGAIQKVSK